MICRLSLIEDFRSPCIPFQFMYQTAKVTSERDTQLLTGLNKGFNEACKLEVLILILAYV